MADVCTVTKKVRIAKCLCYANKYVSLMKACTVSVTSNEHQKMKRIGGEHRVQGISGDGA